MTPYTFRFYFRGFTFGIVIASIIFIVCTIPIKEKIQEMRDTITLQAIQHDTCEMKLKLARSREH